jgi:hypothetical protein
VRDFDMIKYLNIHHARNDNVDRRDLNENFQEHFL